MRSIQFANKSPHKDPTYACAGDSGMDLRAWITDENENPSSIFLKPLERTLVHTGIYCVVPEECEIQVRPKSGRALKEGITVLNTPGTVDERYRNEICVIVINLSNDAVTIKDGEKIAQAVLCPVFNKECVNLIKVDSIDTNTERGTGGFGHTGIN